MTLFDHYFQTFRKQGDRMAFAQEDKTYSYSEFLLMISCARHLLESSSGLILRKPIAVMCHNKVETYASIFACWFSGLPFIPLNPSNPVHWNVGIFRQLDAQLLIDSSPESRNPGYTGLKILDNSSLTKATVDSPFRMESVDLVYILTTSGTTGEPRNVPISLQNMEAFILGFNDSFPALDENDRFLQTYDLTADAAFTAFLIPLYMGATVVLTPDHQFRYLSVAKTLITKHITWVQVTPSLLACLRPYFKSLKLENIRYFHSGGEALPEDLVNEFRPCVPNAEIANIYGPTETTVTAMIYKCPAGVQLISYRGSVSIGKPIGDVEVQILDEDGSFVSEEGEGELLITGSQVMGGYYAGKSVDVFYYLKNIDGIKKYYLTGDKVRRDNNGYYYFLGRLNNQVKISGYRVDLTEVELVLSRWYEKQVFVAVAPEISSGIKKLVVFTTETNIPESEMKKRVFDSYPEFMVPERIITIDRIPLTLSGKTDRKMLEKMYCASLKNE